MTKKRNKLMKALLLVVCILIVGGGALMFLFSIGKLSNVEPKIITLQEPIKMVGLSTTTDTKNVFRDIPMLGKRLQKYKEEQQIANKKEPWAFVAISKDLHQEKGIWTWQYIMGDVVTNFDKVPDGFTSLEIPAQTYAVFTVRPKNRLDWGLAISQMKNYAIDTWLLKSQYESAGSIGDFEYHDERSKRTKNPEIDLYFSIKLRK